MCDTTVQGYLRGRRYVITRNGPEWLSMTGHRASQLELALARVTCHYDRVALFALRAIHVLSFTAALLPAWPMRATEFYVAPAGSDANPGTRSKPFATLERARDEVRRFRQDGKMPKGGLTVWLGGGDYLRTNALALDAADSGTAKAPITWRARKGKPSACSAGGDCLASSPLPMQRAWRGCPRQPAATSGRWTSRSSA